MLEGSLEIEKRRSHVEVLETIDGGDARLWLIFVVMVMLENCWRCRRREET